MAIYNDDVARAVALVLDADSTREAREARTEEDPDAALSPEDLRHLVDVVRQRAGYGPS